MLTIYNTDRQQGPGMRSAPKQTPVTGSGGEVANGERYPFAGVRKTGAALLYALESMIKPGVVCDLYVESRACIQFQHQGSPVPIQDEINTLITQPGKLVTL